MTVSAPAAVGHVVDQYKRFLRTSFRFLDPHLREQFEQHLQGMDVLVRGPYVTLARLPPEAWPYSDLGGIRWSTRRKPNRSRNLPVA